MKRDPSRDVDTLDADSLRAFTGELILAGFEPDPDESAWIGPIDATLSPLTKAKTMRIVIQDGWPFRPPKLFVEGLGPHLHLGADGDVCLWAVGDVQFDWLTLGGLRARLSKWRSGADGGLRDPALDAHLYFRSHSPLLATIDIAELLRDRFLKLSDGSFGELGATIAGKLARVSKDGPVPVRWYFRDSVAVPPSDLQALVAALRGGQERNLTRALDRLSGPLVVLVLWNTVAGLNGLAVLVTRSAEGKLQTGSMELARTDLEILKLRSGPDSSALSSKQVAIFGQGAIGSHVALLLAKSGVGSLTLVDGQRLRPGDVARHASGGQHVSKSKSTAVALTIATDAPWTATRSIEEQPWSPERIEAIVSGVDMVIDATGLQSFAEQLGLLTARLNPVPPLLSIALYRNGSVARARIQLAEGVPLHDRTPANGFSLIPIGPDEQVGWETGCDAPINNAPPASVLASASLAVRNAIDILTRRITQSMDRYEIYSPLDAEGFRECGGRSELA